jgi:hypothetical protein
MEATGMEENKVAGKKGGGIAKKALLELEEKIGNYNIPCKNFFFCKFFIVPFVLLSINFLFFMLVFQNEQQ